MLNYELIIRNCGTQWELTFTMTAVTDLSEFKLVPVEQFFQVFI